MGTPEIVNDAQRAIHVGAIFRETFDNLSRYAIMSHMRQNLSILLDNPLFAGHTLAEVDALLDEGAKPVTFARDAVLFGPGHAPALGFILSGSALVYKAGSEEHHLLMSRLPPGEVFGMASLFHEDAPFPTEIRGEQAGTLLLWPRDSVEAALATHPWLSRSYIGLLSGRIHFLNQRIDALTGDDLRTRLLRVLDALHENSGGTGDFTLPFSLSQMAELLGIGRASLYRTLDALQAEGLLTREGKRITYQTKRRNNP